MVSFTPRPLYPGEEASVTHWLGDWVSPEAGLDGMEKRKFLTLLGVELRPHVREARNQSLYEATATRAQLLIGPSAIIPVLLSENLICCTVLR
jgi:hypothetical protein